MKRYKFTILGKSEETVEVDSLEILDGVFNFIVDGTILRSLFAASLEGPPIEIHEDLERAGAWEREVEISNSIYLPNE